MSTKKLEVPHIFIILLWIMLVVAVLSYILPAGEFNRIEGPEGRMVIEPDSYHFVEKNPTGVMDFFIAIPKGFVEAAWIVALTFCVGGGFVAVKKTMVINGAIAWIAGKLKNRGILIVPVLMLVFAIIDAFIGMPELCLVYVPIILPLIFALGFDSITAVATALVGSAIGFSAALTNPFTIGIGQKIAGLPLYSGWQYRVVVLFFMAVIGISYVMIHARKVQLKPELSCMYELDKKTREILGTGDGEHVTLNIRQKLAGLSAVILFLLMIFGVFNWGWDMPQIGAIFIMIGIVAGVISGMSGKNICDAFFEGFRDVLLGALIVGMARGIAVVMTETKLIDTIIFYLTQMVQNLPGVITSVGMLLVQTVLNFLIPSGSGQTVVTMPIMAPLADLVGLTRQTAVLALQFGDGFSNIFYPVSGYFMATLALGRVPYAKWIKVMLPLFGYFTLASAVFLVIAQLINLGPF